PRVGASYTTAWQRPVWRFSIRLSTLPTRMTGLVGATTELAVSAPVDLLRAQMRSGRRLARVLGTELTVWETRTPWSARRYGRGKSALRARRGVIVICAIARSHGFGPEENRRSNRLWTNSTRGRLRRFASARARSMSKPWA